MVFDSVSVILEVLVVAKIRSIPLGLPGGRVGGVATSEESLNNRGFAISECTHLCDVAAVRVQIGIISRYFGIGNLTQ